MVRAGRHDELALKRQRDLAGALILANLGIGSVSALIIDRYDWSLGLTATEMTLWVAAFAVTLLALLIAAGFIEWLAGALPSFIARNEAGPNPNRLSTFIAEKRMVFYYVGVWANLIALALVTETTGGLQASPFVPVFVAFILTGQQLSRFRTQAFNLLVSGLVLVAAMLAFHSLASEPSSLPPDQLPIAVVVLSLLAGGLLNVFERPHNYLLKKQVPPPTHARIYRDGEGVWRFVFFMDRHSQDPVLLGRSDPSLQDGKFPPELRERFEEHIKEMGKHGSWANVSPEWPAKCKQSFTMRLIATEDDPH